MSAANPRKVMKVVETTLATTPGDDENDDIVQLEKKEETDLTRIFELMVEERPVVNDGSALFPKLSPEADQVLDRLLSDEIEKLSVAEREQVAFDVHGMTQRDDPEDVDRLLEELEQEIRKIHNRKDYEKAKYVNEEYVNDRDFRLLFLRCDLYDTKLAAQRFVKHFEVKRELFGDKCLGRPVRMRDLSEGDLKALDSCLFALLPTRDVVGRNVIVYDQSLKPDVSVHNVMRSIFYVLMTLSRDESYQKQGFVVVSRNFKGTSGTSLSLAGMARFARARQGVPRLVTGVHYCYHNPALRPLVASFMLFIQSDARKRFVAHYGDARQVKFALQTYGIPTEHLFADDKEIIDYVESHREWLKAIRAREESDSSALIDVIIPRRFDVLFGRHKNAREHSGNLRALHLCEMVRPTYEKASKFEKTAIAERIVTSIRESHGRFLKWEENTWVEVDSEAAREKISHFFRHFRSRAPENPNAAQRIPKPKRRNSFDKQPDLTFSETEQPPRASKQLFRDQQTGDADCTFEAGLGFRTV